MDLIPEINRPSTPPPIGQTLFSKIAKTWNPNKKSPVHRLDIPHRTIYRVALHENQGRSTQAVQRLNF